MTVTPLCNRPSETLTSGLFQSNEYKFSLLDTQRIVCFYPAVFFASSVTFYHCLRPVYFVVHICLKDAKIQNTIAIDKNKIRKIQVINLA